MLLRDFRPCGLMFMCVMLELLYYSSYYCTKHTTEVPRYKQTPPFIHQQARRTFTDWFGILWRNSQFMFGETYQAVFWLPTEWGRGWGYRNKRPLDTAQTTRLSPNNTNLSLSHGTVLLLSTKACVFVVTPRKMTMEFCDHKHVHIILRDDDVKSCWTVCSDLTFHDILNSYICNSGNVRTTSSVM
jgi:hypothetical protein